MATILVPTDFSKNADAALRYAIQLCKQMQADLIVFHSSFISAYALSAVSTEEQMTQLIEEDEIHKMEKLQAQVKQAYAHWDIQEIPRTTRCLVSFNPLVVEKTLDVAHTNHADLIVMGTHGASGITKFFFGSNTSIMISKSNIPVLAIPEDHTYRPLANIAFASDLHDLATELNQLTPFAHLNNAEINVLYFDYGVDADDHKISHARDLAKNTGQAKCTLIVQKATLETSLVTQLRKYIASSSPDCLVMFTKERSLWDRLFLRGSKTEDMSAALTIPLLSFKRN